MSGRPPTLPAEEFDARVVRAASREFARRGYAAARVDAIVESSGVSKPALYRAYGSKSALYSTLLERFAGELAAAALSSFAAASGSPAERLETLMDAWFATVAQRPDEWRMLTGARASEPEIAAAVRRVKEMQIRNDISLIQTLVPGLAVAEVEPVAEALRGSLVGLGNWWIDHPAVDRRVPVAAMVRLCTGLIAVTPPPATTDARTQPARRRRTQTDSGIHIDSR